MSAPIDGFQLPPARRIESATLRPSRITWTKRASGNRIDVARTSRNSLAIRKRCSALALFASHFATSEPRSRTISS